MVRTHQQNGGNKNIEQGYYNKENRPTGLS